MATSSTAKRTRLAMWMAMFEDDCAVCCNGGGMDGAKGSERPINAGPTNGLPTAGCCPWPQNTSGRVQSYKYETTDRRAGCGRSASPVRREGQGSIPRPYPYQQYAQATPRGSGILILYWINAGIRVKVRTKSISMQTERTVGYFSMEIALEAGLPTYSGGLGVLAGNTIRSAADLKVPMVAVTLLR